MSDHKTYCAFYMPLKPEHVPADLRNEPDSYKLRIDVVYSKGTRQRGIKMSVARVSINTSGGEISMPFSKYNGRVHLADMTRKNDKIGQAWAERVKAQKDAIYAIATASETPDWQAIAALFHQDQAA